MSLEVLSSQTAVESKVTMIYSHIILGSKQEIRQDIQGGNEFNEFQSETSSVASSSSAEITETEITK